MKELHRLEELLIPGVVSGGFAMEGEGTGSGIGGIGMAGG